MDKMKTQKSTYASPRKVCEEKNKNKNKKPNPVQNFFGQRSTLQKLYQKADGFE